MDFCFSYTLKLLSWIHPRAHAMIFGWVGMFVMGFADQSFPRSKNLQKLREYYADNQWS
jgi:hypothetical protein